ncbi:MAG: tRNA pseudouridine(38-40) synthase TruA [Synergistaceae bacterium]|jgi:tRNA pseudouridine38-40 synthase|nr:tRNA pseudouridine(38-40) synthase TruA [Synergistaceae bacterium]
MARYAIELSYDGTGYSGWQSQPGGAGVQDAVERAFAELGERVRVAGAGRTDAGVHARAQVAHADLSREWDPGRLAAGLNSKLPPSVVCMDAARVGEYFHARRSAVLREYRYFIWNAPACYPHIRPYVLWLRGGRYDWQRAISAAGMFAGTHDFRAFCRTKDCPGNTARTVSRSKLSRRGPLLVFSIAANSYLTNMIRIAIGNLLEIASGRRGENWLRDLLDGAGRRASARTVPPSGLFFWRVDYPVEVFRRGWGSRAAAAPPPIRP